VNAAALKDAPSATGRRYRSLLAAAAIAALAALAFATFHLDRALVLTGFGGVVVVLAVIDLERGIIPNRIVLPATAILLVAQLALFPDRAVEWLLAPVVLATLLLIPTLVRQAWMGMGDVKLALLLGVALGWVAIGATVLALLCAFPVALAVLVRQGLNARKSTIPFGPFLALGALIVVLLPPLAGLGS
jgi:leader peptidase (prepilin peptidase) / N-methyltransferase